MHCIFAVVIFRSNDSVSSFVLRTERQLLSENQATTTNRQNVRGKKPLQNEINFFKNITFRPGQIIGSWLPRLSNNSFSRNNQCNLRIHGDVFVSASRLHWKEGYILQFLGRVLSKPCYTTIPAVPPYFVRTLHMRGAQSIAATNPS